MNSTLNTRPCRIRADAEFTAAATPLSRQATAAQHNRLFPGPVRPFSL